MHMTKQNDPFCRLKSLVGKFGHGSNQLRFNKSTKK